MAAVSADSQFDEILYGDSPFARIANFGFCTVNTTITSISEVIDLLHVVKATPTPTGAPSATSTEQKYFSKEAANGNQLSVPDNSKNFNILTGDEIASSGSNTATTEKYDIEAMITAAQYDKLNGIFRAGTPLTVAVEIGKTKNDDPAGNDFLFGVISDLKWNKDKGPNSATITITGKEVGSGLDFAIDGAVTYSTYNTACTGASNKITPINDNERAIIDLSSGDWTILLTGIIVTKYPAS